MLKSNGQTFNRCQNSMHMHLQCTTHSGCKMQSHCRMHSHVFHVKSQSQSDCLLIISFLSALTHTHAHMESLSPAQFLLILLPSLSLFLSLVRAEKFLMRVCKHVSVFLFPSPPLRMSTSSRGMPCHIIIRMGMNVSTLEFEAHKKISGVLFLLLHRS